MQEYNQNKGKWNISKNKLLKNLIYSILNSFFKIALKQKISPLNCNISTECQTPLNSTGRVIDATINILTFTGWNIQEKLQDKVAMDIFISYRRTGSCLLTVAKIFAVKWRIVYLKEGNFFFEYSIKFIFSIDVTPVSTAAYQVIKPN